MLGLYSELCSRLYTQRSLLAVLMRLYETKRPNTGLPFAIQTIYTMYYQLYLFILFCFFQPHLAMLAITLGSTLRIHSWSCSWPMWNAKNRDQDSRMQGKQPTHCPITLATGQLFSNINVHFHVVLFFVAFVNIFLYKLVKLPNRSLFRFCVIFALCNYFKVFP